MILVFDLDDTLYDELTFVRSGFRAVSLYLENRYSLDRDISCSFMTEKLAGGRNQIFDATLEHFGVYSKTAVRQCINVYRAHEPTINLSKEADECLERFAGLPAYIVTDGHKLVQEKKIVALGLKNRVKFSYVTHRYGTRHSKPSPYCFLQIAKKESVSPNNIVYIGDNPEKDFIGIKPLGFKTIRILQGQFKTVQKTKDYEADFQIASLDELTWELVSAVIS